MHMLVILAKVFGILFVVLGIFYFIFLPLFCAVFHDCISDWFSIKVGAAGKKNGSLFSETYDVELLESVLEDDPVFSDILMYRMNIESNRRKTRIAKRKKQDYKIDDLKRSSNLNSLQLEAAMEAYIKEIQNTRSAQ